MVEDHGVRVDADLSVDQRHFDVMQPVAIAWVGGMTVSLITLLVVTFIVSAIEE